VNPAVTCYLVIDACKWMHFCYVEERMEKIMLNILDATTKFSHLGNQAPDVCASLP